MITGTWPCGTSALLHTGLTQGWLKTGLCGGRCSSAARDAGRSNRSSRGCRSSNVTIVVSNREHFDFCVCPRPDFDVFLTPLCHGWLVGWLVGWLEVFRFRMTRLSTFSSLHCIICMAQRVDVISSVTGITNLPSIYSFTHLLLLLN